MSNWVSLVYELFYLLGFHPPPCHMRPRLLLGLDVICSSMDLLHRGCKFWEDLHGILDGSLSRMVILACMIGSQPFRELCMAPRIFVLSLCVPFGWIWTSFVGVLLSPRPLLWTLLAASFRPPISSFAWLPCASKTLLCRVPRYILWKLVRRWAWSFVTVC